MEIGLFKTRQETRTDFVVALGQAFPMKGVLLRVKCIGCQQAVNVFCILCVKLCLHYGER